MSIIYKTGYNHSEVSILGVTINEMLKTNFFKDFKVLAGEDGLNKEIQGIAIMDAPDGHKWTRGKELIITSGYIYKDREDDLIRYAESKVFNEISGFAIKLRRYIDELPKEFIDICNKKKIPLLSIPIEAPWMTIMNELNVIVMNKTIKEFRIPNIEKSSLSNVPYQELKINKILSQIENEMNFPAMIYDLKSKKAYYSSDNFKKLSYENLKLEDYWAPSFEYTYEILCDNLNITRYRFIDESKYKKPYSWITIPITVGNEIEAYFVIIEEEGLIDYFDQFILRIGFILVQSSYEQILLAKEFENRGFRKLVYDLIEERLPNKKVVDERAEDIGLDIYRDYYMVIFEGESNGKTFNEISDDVSSAYSNTLSLLGGRMTLMDEDFGLLLIPKDETGYEDTLKLIEMKSQDMKDRLESKSKGLDIRFGVSDIATSIYDLKEAFNRCKKTIEIGERLYSENHFIKYSDLGVFAWLDIKEDEFDILLEDIRPLLSKDNQDLLETFKVYLESNMNYSLTAKKLYIHINTVRNRIKEIEDLVDIDIEEPMTRIKLEVILKLVV